MDAINSLLPSLSFLECSWWQALVFIMGVLTLTLGLILIVYNSFHPVAFAVGICMTVASFIFIVLTRVQVLPNKEEPELGSGSESSLRTSQTSVLTSTRV